MTDQRQLVVKAQSTNPEMTQFASAIEANIAEAFQISDAEIKSLISRVASLESRVTTLETP